MKLDAGDKMDLIRKDIARGVRIEIRGKDVANERYILVKSEMKRRQRGINEQAVANHCSLSGSNTGAMDSISQDG